jgi:alkylation response protein AidB-like acyl-CoA dehydrogenase
MSALDAGRLGTAACATGLASSALELAAGYAASRRQFGRPVAEFQGTGFTLADMATAIEAGRPLPERRPAPGCRQDASPSLGQGSGSCPGPAG